MAASSPERLLLAGALGLLALACSIGRGEGTVTGVVTVPSCRLDDPNFDLGVDFFGAYFVNDPELRDATMRREHMTIRLQRGTYRESESDGLLISVANVNEVQTSLLDTPIEVSRDGGSLVRMTLYLGQRCFSGFPDAHWTRSVIMEAESGTIRFSAIYTPALGDTDNEISATFDGVTFTDAADPTWSAVLSGAFTFSYQRGAPAQPFP